MLPTLLDDGRKGIWPIEKSSVVMLVKVVRLELGASDLHGFIVAVVTAATCVVSRCSKTETGSIDIF